MKVEFAQEEVQAMALYLVEQLLDQKLGRAATLPRRRAARRQPHDADARRTHQR
jgi:hypothetical protein